MSNKDLDIEQIKAQEIKEETEAAQRNDFSYSWVSSSKFLFYLTSGAFVLMTWGGCYRLYQERFKKVDVPVQESTLYSPKYK